MRVVTKTSDVALRAEVPLDVELRADAPIDVALRAEVGRPVRHCVDCQLCCKLLPIDKDEGKRSARLVPEMVMAGWISAREAALMIPEFVKPAGERCPHQRHHKGCNVYDRRPLCCRIWNCRWLVSDDTADLRRPDRTHYVIDIMPDVVRMVPDDGSASMDIEVVQVWVDPKFPDAWKDPALRDYMLRRAHEGKATMIRYDSANGFTVFPPPLSSDHEWHDSREVKQTMFKRHGHDLDPDNWKRDE
jgi:hypothetical protein